MYFTSIAQLQPVFLILQIKRVKDRTKQGRDPMKLSITIFITMLISIAQASTPIETLIPVDEVFSPVGFDSNDTSEVIISGWLPNLCHKSPQTSVTVTGNDIDITVSALRYDESDIFCPEMIVPFVKSVHVGILDKGQYNITVNGKTLYAKKSEINIEESSSNAIDDYIYANVSYVEQKLGTQMVALKGFNPSDCLVLDKVEFISNGINAYSVLPKMKKIRDFCPMKLVPFTHIIEVPETLKHQKVLLHVRSMDGNSVNSLFIKSN